MKKISTLVTPILALFLMNACADTSAINSNSTVDMVAVDANSRVDDSRLDDLGPLRNSPSRICPLPPTADDIVTMAKDAPDTPFVDDHKPVKNFGTDFVVEQVFGSPETLYNFLDKVYTTMDDALKEYRKNNKLEDRAIFLLFKGGNVLRMIANTLFSQLPVEASDLLKNKYSPDFKRSDADFIVYIDAQKLGNQTYDKTYVEVTDLLFKQLNIIRTEFKDHPEKYFTFTQLPPAVANPIMHKYFEKLNGKTGGGVPDVDPLFAVKDATNKSWYQAVFRQFQFRNVRAEEWPKCTYFGQYDQRIEALSNTLLSRRLTDKPDWIVNTDNRTLGWTWGSDPSKTVKFTLVRSKIYFEYIYEHNNELKRKAVGGELIDVGIPHRDDDRLRPFLDGYDNNVAEYTIYKNATEKLTLKAYSLLDLAEDLQFIIFDSFKRPWKDPGGKYTKRVSRLFFLFNAESLGAYGLGAEEAREYIKEVRETILLPVKYIYPSTPETPEIVKYIIDNADALAQKYRGMPMANHFWQAFAKFIAGPITQDPQDGDQKGLEELTAAIENNLDIAMKLAEMSPVEIDLGTIYHADLKTLF